MRSKTLAVALTTAVLLAACGGGGDDAPAPAPAPQPSPAPAPAPSPSPSPAPAPTTGPASTDQVNTAKADVGKAVAVIANEALRAYELVGFDDTSAGSCTATGTYEINFKDVADASVATTRPLANGDTFEVVYDNCQFTGGATRDGTVSYKVGDATLRTGTVTFTGFSIVENGSTENLALGDTGSVFDVVLTGTSGLGAPYTATVAPDVPATPWSATVAASGTSKVYTVTDLNASTAQAGGNDGNATPTGTPTYTDGSFSLVTTPATTPPTLTGDLN